MDIQYELTAKAEHSYSKSESDFKIHLGALLNTMQDIFEQSDEFSSTVKLIDNLIEEAVSEHFLTLEAKISRLSNFLDYTDRIKYQKSRIFSGVSNEIEISDGNNVNELLSEPIKIPEIPIPERQYEITTKQAESVLDVLDKQYKIQLSLDRKDISEILSLKLEEDLGLSAMDIKLFIPSMFMNKVNAQRMGSVTFLYQEDYSFIERISTNGTFHDLVQLYSILDNRNKPIKEKEYDPEATA
jgi:hypothetical protein